MRFKAHIEEDGDERGEHKYYKENEREGSVLA